MLTLNVDSLGLMPLYVVAKMPETCYVWMNYISDMKDAYWQVRVLASLVIIVYKVH